MLPILRMPDGNPGLAESCGADTPVRDRRRHAADGSRTRECRARRTCPDQLRKLARRLLFFRLLVRAWSRDVAHFDAQVSARFEHGPQARGARVVPRACSRHAPQSHAARYGLGLRMSRSICAFARCGFRGLGLRLGCSGMMRGSGLGFRTWRARAFRRRRFGWLRFRLSCPRVHSRCFCFGALRVFGGRRFGSSGFSLGLSFTMRGSGIRPYDAYFHVRWLQISKAWMLSSPHFHDSHGPLCAYSSDLLRAPLQLRF